MIHLLNKEHQKPKTDKPEIDYLRSICGPFLRGTAVCEGYAKALQYLLNKCGIEAFECAGKILGEREGYHAWLCVKMDGDYYYMDTTADDYSDTVQVVKKKDYGFTYFGVTSEEMRRSRNDCLCPVEPPYTTATRCNYFVHNGLFLDKYDIARIEQIALAAIDNGRNSFSIKFGSLQVYREAIKKLCAEGNDMWAILKKAKKTKNAAKYTYGPDEKMRIITIWVKDK